MDTNEKQGFSERLKLALRRSTKPVETPTDLALQFNLRHENDPVTMQAAQKWLTGKAKPTPDKIATLAEWLNVSAHWLSHGDPEPRPAKSNSSNQIDIDKVSELTEEELQMVARFRRLPAQRQKLVRDLLIELGLDNEVWPGQ